MQRKLTGFFTDEWCFWHSTDLHANVLPNHVEITKRSADLATDAIGKVYRGELKNTDSFSPTTLVIK